MFDAGSDGGASSSSGEVVASVIGVKSRTGSYGSFSTSRALLANELNVNSSV